MLKGILIGAILTLVVEHVGLTRVGVLADQGVSYAAQTAGKVRAEVANR